MFATLRYLLFLPSKIAQWTLFQRNSNKLGKSLGQLILWFLFGYLDSVVLAHLARKTLIQQCGAFLALSSLPEKIDLHLVSVELLLLWLLWPVFVGAAVR